MLANSQKYKIITESQRMQFKTGDVNRSANNLPQLQQWIEIEMVKFHHGRFWP
jgi:hypothetical protein